MPAVPCCCRFTPAIEQVNTGLKDLAASSHSVQFVDCGSKFIDHGRLNSKLMPDGEFQGWGWSAVWLGRMYELHSCRPMSASMCNRADFLCSRAVKTVHQC